MARHPAESALILADFSGARFDKDVAAKMKEVLVRDRPYVKRAARVGADGVPHVFYENFKSFSQRQFPIFKTQDEAME